MQSYRIWFLDGCAIIVQAEGEYEARRTAVLEAELGHWPCVEIRKIEVVTVSYAMTSDGYPHKPEDTGTT